MKQEHRFVADLYSCLFPFMDAKKPIYVSLDGEAAKQGKRESLFHDANVPDLWFTLVGNTSPTLLEAKVVNADGSIIVGRSQLSAWRSKGNEEHKPAAWVVSNHELTEFDYWSHEDFLKRLDNCASRQKYPRIRPPENKRVFHDVRALALHILRAS